MASHGVLVERQQQIQLISMIKHLLIRHSHREKNMAASNDGLIGIVGVQMKPPAHKDPGQNIAGRSNSLPGCTSNG